MIDKLYEVKRKADEAGMSVDQRRELRQKEAYPVIQLIERWCVNTHTEVLESSLLGKAIAYTYYLMDRLAVYVNDGHINIDNNLIGNAIRPLALGRKNWLFSGNDASAYRAAIVYSLIASYRAADVDPRQWLEHVLIEIPSRRKTGQSMEDLLPSEYTKRYDIKPWNLPDTD
ncbi:MAG: IS66 family transposase [Bacteroides sp.]|nr:IS66 family transposase [Bacteroides sp.]